MNEGLIGRVIAGQRIEAVAGRGGMGVVYRATNVRTHTGPEANPIRVFTIAYGSDAVGTILDKIAETSDGQPSTGDTGNIGSVYRSISSFF